MTMIGFGKRKSNDWETQPTTRLLDNSIPNLLYNPTSLFDVVYVGLIHCQYFGDFREWLVNTLVNHGGHPRVAPSSEQMTQCELEKGWEKVQTERSWRRRNKLQQSSRPSIQRPSSLCDQIKTMITRVTLHKMPLA